MSATPIAPRRPHEITQHGQTRIDNYFWMRYREDPDVLKYLHAENDYQQEIMQHTQALQDSLFVEMKVRIKETDSSAPEKRGEYFYYTRTEQGRQYPLYCRKPVVLEGPEEILLDQNKIAEGRSFCRIGAFSVSPDGSKLAYSVDPDGSEKCVLLIKNLLDGTLYPLQYENTYGSVYDHGGVEWAADSQTFFYLTLDHAQRPDKLWRHTLGADPAADPLLFHEEDETFFLFVIKTRSEKFIMTYHISTMTREMRFLPAADLSAELKVVQPRQRGLEYYAEHHGDSFLIIANDNARNFKLLRAPLAAPGRENWVEVIPHREDTLIENLYAFRGHLVLEERRGGLKQLRISAPDGVSAVRYVEFPEPAYTLDGAPNPEFDATAFRFDYTSLVTPLSVIDFDMTGSHSNEKSWRVVKEQEIPSGYDKTQFVSERIFALAPDGAQVPLSIVYKKGLQRNGENPCLLYSYGSYGASTEPSFNANRLCLLERGFVYAVGHIRGGSELGRAWYEDGRMFKKRNTFTDFIACAETLIHEKYTSSPRLAIMGGSAGGLLVGAALTMRPDLFGAVIAKVPFVDVVNTMSDASIPLTTLEYDQWGNPDERQAFDYLMSYSPYDNIRATAYPDLLITTGLNDPRVAYWEPAKFAARLRELKTGSSLLLLKTNFDAGHAGASGRYENLKEIAFDYAFLMDRLAAGQ
jgi:oligopeptidase B